jgi:hypothetical protein
MLGWLAYRKTAEMLSCDYCSIVTKKLKKVSGTIDCPNMTGDSQLVVQKARRVRLMRQAVEVRRLRHRRAKAIEKLLALRKRTRRVSEKAVQAARKHR